MIRLFTIALIVILIPSIGHAACTAPDGSEGNMVYNTTHKTMQFCDGNNWWSMKGSFGGNGGHMLVTDLIVPNYSTGYSSYTGLVDISSYDFIEFGGFDRVSGGGWSFAGAGTASTVMSVYNDARGAINLGSEHEDTQITATIDASKNISFNFGGADGGIPRLAFVRGIKVSGGGGGGGGGGRISGEIQAFDLTSCPSGWSEYTVARGRFLRGIDNGAGNDPSGTRAPGNVQADEIRSHSHTQSVNAPDQDRGNAVGNNPPGSNRTNLPVRNATVSTLPHGGAETRPKKMSLCCSAVKINQLDCFLPRVW